MKTSILLITLLTAFSPAYADTSFYLGGSTGKFGTSDNWTAEVGFHSFLSSTLLAQGSLMYFEQNNLFYEGGNFSFSLTTPEPISLYTGVGGFLGSNEKCYEDSDTLHNVCRDTLTAGVYPEVGVILTLGTAHIGAFARRYKTFEGGRNNFTMYGLRFGGSY